jgi:hypothetical protein
MRSKLWDAKPHVDRATLPTIGQMLNDQTGIRSRRNARGNGQRYAPDL